MSSIGDALKGVQRLLLMQEKIAQLDSSIQTLAANQKQLAAELVSVDKRVIRIETLIEVSMGRGSPPPRPAIEG